MVTAGGRFVVESSQYTISILVTTLLELWELSIEKGNGRNGGAVFEVAVTAVIMIGKKAVLCQ